MIYLWMALAAATGGALRFILSRDDQEFPTGTLTVNLAGSFLAGLLSNLATPELQVVLIAGFCGGLTTYSTFAWQTKKLAKFELSYLFLSIIGGIVCCWLGHQITT